MKFILVLSLAFLACAQAKEAGLRRYDGYQVYSVTATTREQYLILWNIYTTSEGNFDFWTQPAINSKTDVMVAPEEQTSFKSLLEQNGISFEVKVSDVQELITEEQVQMRQARARGNGKIGWDSYPRHSEIVDFVNDLPSVNGIAAVEVIGKSSENRDIQAVKISNNANNKKAIFIDANIHAREWITSATATWFLNQVINNTSEHADLLEGIDYYVIPMVNPDGYEFAQTSDRMWRKTRSVNAGSLCRGCDPNRNFPYYFGGESTSNNPCSDLYHGPKALSEPEAKAVSDYMIRLMDDGVNIVAYISMHSYGQLWLLPWGYTAGAYPEDYADQLSLGNEVLAAIRSVHRTSYTTGTAADVLYGVGGASDDYAKSIGIKYTVTAEMRDKGNNGFVLPPAQIIPNAEEIMAGLKVVANRVRSEK